MKVRFTIGFTFSAHDRTEIMDMPDDSTEEYLRETLEYIKNEYLDCYFERIEEGE